MSEESLLDGEFGYSFKSNEGKKIAPERTFDEEFALVTFTGDVSELPKNFKMNLTIQKAERFEEGDKLMLKDGQVKKFNHELDRFSVTATDSRKKQEINLTKVTSELFCPTCGDKIWEAGKEQKFISCDECCTYIDVYGKGENIVFESGP